MNLADAATATIPASQLAALLATYGEMPVAVQVIQSHAGHEYAATEGAEGVHCEINTRSDGSRYLAIVGYDAA